MRKYVVGIVIGILLASALPVSAAVSTLVGKKITNEYKITVDGQDIGIKAIVVDGISYTPNRALVGAMGGDVKFIDKTVVVTTDKTSQAGGGTVEIPVKSELQAIESQIKQLKAQEVDIKKKANALYADSVRRASEIRGTPEEQRIKDEYDALVAEGEQVTSRLAELERQKAALEAQN